MIFFLSYAFSIWSFIYLLQILFLIYCWFELNENCRDVIQLVGSYFALTCVFNVLWCVLFVYDY